ncbi:mCG1047673, partial [Mus musculus]
PHYYSARSQQRWRGLVSIHATCFLSLFRNRNCRRHQSFRLLDGCKSCLLYVGAVSQILHKVLG